MKRMRRNFVILAALIGLGALGCWISSVTKPVITFAGFRDETGERVAVFTIENRPTAGLVFNAVTISDLQNPEKHFRVIGTQKDLGSSITREGGGDRTEFTIALRKEDGARLTSPFQVNVHFVQMPSPLMEYRALSWLPKSFRATKAKTFSSEVVRP